MRVFICFIFLINCTFVVAGESICQSGPSSAAVNLSKLYLSEQVLQNKKIKFIEHIGKDTDEFGTALAMNVSYDPVRRFKLQLDRRLKLQTPLEIYKGWSSLGEAHITTITPVEYHNILRPYLSPQKISQIAKENNIQKSDLEILGLGCGSAVLDGKVESAFFIIVHSENLLRIRAAIEAEYLRKGGVKGGFSADHFYPHITLGFTRRDLHESDGVIKDLVHSKDPRFSIKIVH